MTFFQPRTVHDQQQRHFGPFGRPLQNQSDILKTFKEHSHEALLDVLQAFHEFRNHVNMMVNNMDAVALEDSRQAFKTVKYLRQFQTTFFRAFIKTKVRSVRLHSCPCQFI